MSHVRYIDKTRAYYAGLGYDKPYQWAEFAEVPFAALAKPLREARVALVSTSDVAVRGADEGDAPHGFMVGKVYSIAADTAVEQLFTRQEHYDTHATHLDDVNSYFPITRLHELAAEGVIGSVASRAHGVYTNYSHRRTLEADGPEVVKRCREDGVDAVVLTPV